MLIFPSHLLPGVSNSIWFSVGHRVCVCVSCVRVMVIASRYIKYCLQHEINNPIIHHSLHLGRSVECGTNYYTELARGLDLMPKHQWWLRQDVAGWRG